MKYLWLCWLTAFSLIAEAQKGIRVEIHHLRNNNGQVLLSLFKDPNGFPDVAEKAVFRVAVPIEARKAVYTFPSVPPGRYAVAVLHDENGDRKLNTNSLGLPKEGYGFSNNVAGAFGPPSFKRASFVHGAAAETSIKIRTRY